MGGGKSEKKFLPETHVYREQKNNAKNSSGKSVKTRFFINTRISRGRGGKKLTGKSAKYVFYKHTNIVIKKRGEKNA